MERKLTIGHNAGFFSCCMVRLCEIVEFLNRNKILPDVVDSSQQFSWYKKDNSKDLTFEYFDDYNNYIIIPNVKTRFHWTQQYANYSTINYDGVVPIFNKYFTPSYEIKDMIKNLEKKYDLDYENICVLFYRGNDKNRETLICSYEEYIPYAKKIKKENSNIKFLIQSDETEFITKMLETFPDESFYMKDEIRHMSKSNITVDYITPKVELLHFSKLYLAITVTMSKCKTVICGSGNCSLAIMLYRGNSNNVYQNLMGTWLTL